MSYPKSLAYFSQKLVGYSKNRFRLSALANTSASSGSIIEFELPSSSIVDLRTLTMYFKMSTSTSGGFAAPSKHIETIIDRIVISAGGTILDSGCRFTNEALKILFDLQMGADKEPLRGIMQNGGNITTLPTANVTNQQFAISNWTGFLSCEPSCLDMSLFPSPVRVQIYLAPASVLRVSTGATNANYQLQDIRFEVDTIDIADGVYNQLLMQRLQQGAIEVVFNKMNTFLGTATASGGSIPWSVSTQSLEMLMGTLLEQSFQGIGAQNTNAPAHSWYFKRGDSALALTNSQFSINNVPYPQFSTDLSSAFMQTIQSFGLNQDSIGGSEKDMDSLDKYKSQYFVHAVRLGHLDSGSERLMSGLDTRATSLQSSWNVTYTGTTLHPLVIAISKSSVMLGAFRQIQVVN